VLIAIGLAAALGVATKDINFWPTDAKIYYFDAVVRLPHLKHLSQIHTLMDSERVRWLHGKEILILALSWMQRLTGDYESLRPFVWLFLLANFFSSLLVYGIALRYWGRPAALVCFTAFAGSFCPYLYVLFAKHQPLGLVFFLLAVFLAQRASARRGWAFFAAGASMGLSLFSSPASTLYVPWFAAACALKAWPGTSGPRGWRGALYFLWAGAAVILGILFVVVYVNWPDVTGHVRAFLDYVSISGSHNHFFYNQPFLQQWFGARPVADIRGGWAWVFRYFMLIMPVLFPFYLLTVLACLLALLKEKSSSRRLKTAGAVFLSALPVVLIERVRVAQYGGNYFPCFMGIVFMLGYGFNALQEGWPKLSGRPAVKTALLTAGLLIAAGHVLVNAAVFAADIYPTRLASTFFSDQLRNMNVRKIYTYREHPHRNHFVPYLSPDIYKNIQIVPVDSLLQAKDGYVLLPPVTGDSIYIPATSAYADFDRDDLLNEIMAQGRLGDYAVLDRRTIASSRVWLHEEEILSYRKLMLGHALPVDDLRSHVLLLDGVQIWRDIKSLIPRPEFRRAREENIRFVGNDPPLYVFRGRLERIQQPATLRSLVVRMGKQGHPADAVRVYAYRLDSKQPVWVPLGPVFASRAVKGEDVSDAADGGAVVFSFEPALRVQPGYYLFMIYRTGARDKGHYYKVFSGDITRL